MIQKLFGQLLLVNINVNCITSFALLYSIDEVIDPQITLKSLHINGIGHRNPYVNNFDSY